VTAAALVAASAVRARAPLPARVASRKFVRTLDSGGEGQRKELNDVVYLPDGARLATVGADLTLRLWERASGRLVATLHGPERALQTVVASPDGKRLYTGGAEGDVRTWDLAALDPARTIRIAECAVDWSSDGRWIASTGNDGKVMLWNAESGAAVRELESIGDQILSAAFRPDASLLAAPGAGGSVQLWHVPSGEPAATLDDGGGRAGYVVWSPDGKRLAAGHPDGGVRLWDVDARKLVRRLDGHPAGQVALAFHPDEQLLVSASGRDVRRWDAASGAALGQLPPAASAVHYLAWSPDGSRLAAGLANNTLEVWHAASGEVLLRVPYTAGVFCVAWNGADLFALPMDDTVRVLRGELQDG